jgi:hypothetical protein
MQEFPATYGFDAFRTDMDRRLGDYLKHRSTFERVSDQKRAVSRDSDRWNQARRFGKKETPAEFAERLYAETANMDADKAAAFLELELSKNSEELDKALSQFSEVALETTKAGLKGWAGSPDVIEGSVGIFDKVRKFISNPHAAKEERLGAVKWMYREASQQSAHRMVILAQMALNSTAIKTEHRLRSINVPQAKSDVIDGFKATHAAGMPDLAELSAALPSFKDLMESAKIRSKKVDFDVENAVSLYDTGIRTTLPNPAQAIFCRSHSDRFVTTSEQAIETAYGRLSDLLEASSLSVRAADRVNSMFQQRPDYPGVLIRPRMFLSAVKGACQGESFDAPSSSAEKVVAIPNALRELEIAKMLAQAEGLRNPELRPGSIRVSVAINETVTLLNEMAKHGIRNIKISTGPAETDFFARLREEIGWQHEPIKSMVAEQAARDVARRQQSFSDHARGQMTFGERLVNQVSERIRASVAVTTNEQPDGPLQPSNAAPPVPRPR